MNNKKFRGITGIYGSVKRKGEKMRLQRVSSNDVAYKKSNTAFKSKYIFDVGASDPRGSLKILVQDNKGKDLFEYKGFVNDTTKGFAGNDDFIKKIANAVDVETLIDKDMASINSQIAANHLSEKESNSLVEKLKALSKNKATLQARSASEKELTGFALLLPGTMQGQSALFMPNIRDLNENSLENVKLTNIIKNVRKNGKVKISPAFNIKRDFIPCKDLAGTGVAMAKQISSHPTLKERFSKGLFATVVLTGGGFGEADIKVLNNSEVLIETGEAGHNLFFDRKTNSPRRLGALGASTGSVIENFASKLDITNPDDIKALKKTGLAQLATQPKIKFDSVKDKAAIEVLKKTGFYDVNSHSVSSTTLKIKDIHMDKFKAASAYSVQSYADTLALHAITKINTGSNLYVLTGPLGMGLDSTIKEYPETYGAKNMRELIFKYVNEYVGHDFTCNKMTKGHNFDIVCDASLNVSNNTSGGALLLSKHKPEIFARRGEWIVIPKKVLKAMPKAIR